MFRRYYHSCLSADKISRTSLCRKLGHEPPTLRLIDRKEAGRTQEPAGTTAIGERRVGLGGSGKNTRSAVVHGQRGVQALPGDGAAHPVRGGQRRGGLRLGEHGELLGGQHPRAPVLGAGGQHPGDVDGVQDTINVLQFC